MTTLRPVLLACCLIAACAGHALARHSTSAATGPSTPGAAAVSSSGWNYIVEPYLLAPSMSGTSGIGGQTSDVNASASDILGALDFGEAAIRGHHGAHHGEVRPVLRQIVGRFRFLGAHPALQVVS